jgi:spore protease
LTRVRQPPFFPITEFPVRTDLAVEAREALAGDVPGVTTTEERGPHVKVTRVDITSPAGAQRMGKPQGHYVTLEATGLRQRDRDLQDEVARVLATELARLVGSLVTGHEFTTLVVGLGNWNATPDALGPRVVSKILVTRHVRDFMPQELRGQLRPVAAISPGVLGTTGIDTSAIVRGVIDRVRPDVVVAVDALAARSLERMLTTIQLADTGISPGSGVGPERGGLDLETLGIPVVAVGVPTVVHAMTIASETVAGLAEMLHGTPRHLGALESMPPEEKHRLINEVLTPAVGELMVTPKEIDVYVDDLARLVAGAINVALHPGVDIDELSKYLM